ncbi:hypothetical protein [Halobaculum sp. MBLA0143]|uniref:DUF7344 domain-containing protein n=1 Tax=Halobaculum sp. MBLA0143 TaxID=3079933 RepID=UPI00352561CA
MQSAVETDAVETDELFETLSNRRRRHAIHYLVGVGDGETVAIGELAEQLAAWENDVELSAVSARQRKRLYTALHQTHLPKLDRLDIVDYDSARGTVAVGAEMPAFDVYFDVIAGDDVPWSQFYLGFALVSLLVVAASGLGVPPFVVLDGYTGAWLVAGGLLVVASVHIVHSRQRRLRVVDSPPER